MASAPSYPSWLAREERVVGRAPTDLTVTLAGLPAEVTDVSALGCRVRTAAAGGVGAFLTLEGAVRVSGWVARRRGDMLGLDFAHALTDAQVAALASAQ